MVYLVIALGSLPVLFSALAIVLILKRPSLNPGRQVYKNHYIRRRNEDAFE